MMILMIILVHIIAMAIVISIPLIITSPEESIWSLLAAGFMGLSVLGQTSSGHISSDR